MSMHHLNPYYGNKCLRGSTAGDRPGPSGSFNDEKRPVEPPFQASRPSRPKRKEVIWGFPKMVVPNNHGVSY